MAEYDGGTVPEGKPPRRSFSVFANQIWRCKRRQRVRTCAARADGGDQEPPSWESPDLLLAVLPAMSPLDCSMAVKALALMPDSAVTIPPLPKVVSKLPAWACATLTPNTSPVPSSRASTVSIDD